MTAPTRSRSQSAARQRARAAATKTAPERLEPAPRKTQPRDTPSRGRTSAAERAYARRAQRTAQGRPEAAAESAPGWRARLAWPRSRASFVLLLMGLLVAGVATTLWLSTQSIADSYRLEEIRNDTAGLAERAERLQREVARDESAFSLAEKAKAQGMVPSGDPAYVVVGPDGGTRVVGEPKAVTAPEPAAPAPPPAPDEAATVPAPVDQAPPAEQPPADEAPADEAAPEEQAAPPPEAEGAAEQGAETPQAGGR